MTLYPTRLHHGWKSQFECRQTSVDSKLQVHSPRANIKECIDTHNHSLPVVVCFMRSKIFFCLRAYVCICNTRTHKLANTHTHDAHANTGTNICLTLVCIGYVSELLVCFVCVKEGVCVVYRWRRVCEYTHTPFVAEVIWPKSQRKWQCHELVMSQT